MTAFVVESAIAPKCPARNSVDLAARLADSHRIRTASSPTGAAPFLTARPLDSRHGSRGGQVYGSSDSKGAFPKTQACGPADMHATIFRALGISPRAELRDPRGRPLPVSDGQVLPLF